MHHYPVVQRYPDARFQTGAVLAVSLFFLVVLTMMGTFAVRTTILQERMAGNMSQYYSAQQSAESALREIETCVGNFEVRPNIASLPNPSGTGCDAITVLQGRERDPAKDYYPTAMVTHLSITTSGKTDNEVRAAVLKALAEDLDASDWQALGQETTTPVADNIAAQPRFVVEEARFEPDGLTVGLGVPPGRYVYQITAVGYAGNTTFFKVVQSQYLHRY